MDVVECQLFLELLRASSNSLSGSVLLSADSQESDEIACFRPIFVHTHIPRKKWPLLELIFRAFHEMPI